MHATTVKLDAKLAKMASAVKPANLTLTAFIRSLVEREAKHQEQRASALAYEAFLAKNPDETVEMAEWESATLSQPPQAKRATRKKK